MHRKTVVVGIGNPFLQDDRVGLVVIEQLERSGLPCRLETVATTGLEVLDKIRGYRHAILVDGCRLGRRPGTILEWTVDDLVRATPSLGNVHIQPLATTLQTGDLCFPAEMPEDLRILLIEVKRLEEFSLQLSPEVEAAVGTVVELIRRRISGAGEKKG